MIRIAYDMETSDPDDVMTMCILATHPRVDLVAVTVTPGSFEQVGIIKHVLRLLVRDDIPVGSFRPESKPGAVSGFHDKWLGRTEPEEPDGLGYEILASALKKYEGVVVLTGAPLKNLGVLLDLHPDIVIPRWVAQGGFAGDSVVPEERRLAKFAGRETCPTFNFNGDPKSAFAMLSSTQVLRRVLVSKNVCHGVTYGPLIHSEMFSRKLTRGWELVRSGMDVYLRGRPEGKMFHDPMAAAVAIDESVCSFREVEVYREKGEWGSRLSSGTRTSISVSVDINSAFSVLLETN